eukprot:Gb_00598 [translate_table: standard]
MQAKIDVLKGKVAVVESHIRKMSTGGGKASHHDLGTWRAKICLRVGERLLAKDLRPIPEPRSNQQNFVSFEILLRGGKAKSKFCHLWKVKIKEEIHGRRVQQKSLTLCLGDLSAILKALCEIQQGRDESVQNFDGHMQVIVSNIGEKYGDVGALSYGVLPGWVGLRTRGEDSFTSLRDYDQVCDLVLQFEKQMQIEDPCYDWWDIHNTLEGIRENIHHQNPGALVYGLDLEKEALKTQVDNLQATMTELITQIRPPPV